MGNKAEFVVERPAMVEEQRKAVGQNGNKLHRMMENEKGPVVEEDDDYAKFVLAESLPLLLTLTTRHLGPPLLITTNWWWWTFIFVHHQFIFGMVGGPYP